MQGPRFDVITLFPDQFPGLVEFGVVGRALKNQLFNLNCWNPRDFTDDLHRTVDDRPYGGGPGMVMLAEPLVRCVRAIREARGDNAPVLFLTPHGPLLKQAHVRCLSDAGQQGAIFLCGRYEGVDQRFIDAHVDQTYCLGDFVLSGGELAVACFVDAWVRLLPDVLNHALSATQDSFEAGLLDCPHFTRPEVYENKAVPSVLLSGNHAKIESWRFEQAKAYTERFRPDLLEGLSKAVGTIDTAGESEKTGKQA
jgi:tRNA (guanine37-N1)-methyltransferase